MMGGCMVISAVFLACGLVWLPEIQNHLVENLFIFLAALSCVYLLLIDSQVRMSRQNLGQKPKV